MFPLFSTASVQLSEATTAERCKLAPSNVFQWTHIKFCHSRGLQSLKEKKEPLM